MEGQDYTKRTKRITVGMPKTLHNTVVVKLKFSEYATISELVRDLLRKWTSEEIIKVKPIGRIEG